MARARISSSTEGPLNAGLDDNTIIAFSTDNGAENFTWPDGGQTPFAAARALLWRAASAYLRSFDGRARYRRAKSRTASFPALTGFRLSSKRLAMAATSPQT